MKYLLLVLSVFLILILGYFTISSFTEPLSNDANRIVIAGSSSGIRILKPIAELYMEKNPSE